MTAMTGNETICPACELSGSYLVVYSCTINPVSGAPSYTAHGLECNHCPHCGEDWVPFEKGSSNDQKYEAAKAKAESLLGRKVNV